MQVWFQNRRARWRKSERARLETQLDDQNQERQSRDDDVSRPQSTEPEVEVVDNIDADMTAVSRDGRQCMQLEMIAQRPTDNVKPLFSEISDTQITSNSSRTTLSSSTPAAAAVVWNFDECRRLGCQSGIGRCEDNHNYGCTGNARQWPNVAPLDLSVTSRSVTTPRDDVTVRYSDLPRRLYMNDDKRSAAR